jgi:hypothetical protein
LRLYKLSERKILIGKTIYQLDKIKNAGKSVVTGRRTPGIFDAAIT